MIITIIKPYALIVIVCFCHPYLIAQNSQLLTRPITVNGHAYASQQDALLAEVERDLMEDKYYLQQIEWRNKTEYYRKAYDQLMKMDKDNFSVMNATFIVENAYLDGGMSYEKYLEAVRFKVHQVKQMLKWEQLDTTSDLAKNYEIQKLFSQPNDYFNRKTRQIQRIPPLKYDFEDFAGEKDYTKTFVAKLLITGKGQCQSLPRSYLIIAEQLNAKAWLSLAPQHSFIKFQDSHGNLLNFETTNGNTVSSNWLLQSGLINANALKNRTYLDTLSKRQLYAQYLAELLSGYLKKFSYDGFAKQIHQKIFEINPENLAALIIDANLKKEIALRQIIAAGHPSEQELPKYPTVHKAYLEMVAAFEKIDNSGYQDMPEEAYKKWLRSLNQEKKKQENKEFKERIQRELKSFKKIKPTFINIPKG